MQKKTLVGLSLLAALWVAPAAHAAPPTASLEAYIYAKCKNTYGATRSREKARYYAPLITRQARRHGLDPRLVASLVWHESNFNPREVSSAGALGLCQVMPLWFRHYRVPLSAWKNPEANLGIALRLYQSYRARMAKRYPGLPTRALEHRTLVAYNMGPRAVSRGIHRSRYSRKILADTLR